MAEENGHGANDINKPSSFTVAHVPSAPPDEPSAHEDNEPLSLTVTHRPVLPLCRPGRYAAKRLHARGGMGEVWLAEDIDIGRQVALKRLRKERSEQIERFLIEAQVTGQLDHPGIVPLHDLGADENGQPFYIMSFVAGQTLKDAVAEYHGRNAGSDEPREVTRRRLLEVFVQLCRTVAYAHSRGVIHRDIKPDNVMLGRYGETIVLDWGLAKVMGTPETPPAPGYVSLTIGASSSATMFGAIIGAPPYMAPEEAEGKSSEADERTDVYLLGSTLYEILTGRPPRQGSSKDEMIELARTVSPVPPRQVNPQVPRALDAICLRAMSRRKEDRYTTALEMAQEMQRYLAGEPVAAFPESLPRRAWRWCKKHHQVLAWSAASALMLGMVLFGLTLLARGKQREIENAERAGKLERVEQARLDVRRFRKLADELHFHAASTDAPNEQAPFFDRERGEKSGLAALALAQKWGPQLHDLPLDEEREAVRTQLSTVLLLLVQLQSHQQKDRTVIEGQLALLDQAEALNGSSRSLHRLRAECYRLLGKGKLAAGERKLAENPEVRLTATDHFLQAERYRLETTNPAAVSAERPGWKVDRDLLDKAVAEYKAALSLAPEHYWAHFQLGRCQLSLGQKSEAVQTLGACVALRPTVAWGYSARGLALISLGQFEHAERDINMALEEEPEFLPALLNRGVLYWRQREYEKARADFSTVLNAPPERRLIEAAYYRGLVELERGRYAEALKDFNLLAENRPGFWPVYLLRTRAHFWLKDEERGLADLDAYLAKAGPSRLSRAETLERRGTLMRRLLARKQVPVTKKMRDLTLAQLIEAEKLGGKSVALYRELGAMHDPQAPDKAIAYYSKGLAIERGNAELRNLRGWLYASLEKVDNALEDFTVAARAEANDPAARRNRAEAHAGMGYLRARGKAPQKALDSAGLALLWGGDNYLIIHNVACIHAEMADVEVGRDRKKEHEDSALEHLRRAVELCRQSGKGTDEVEQMKREAKSGSFRSLKARPEFQELLASGK